MELLVALLAGIAIGAVGCAAILLGRIEADRRRRQVAVEAELTAARTRAERATSEAQALRTRLAAVEAQAARVDGLESELAAARVELAGRAPDDRGGARRAARRVAAPEAAVVAAPGIVAGPAMVAAASPAVVTGPVSEPVPASAPEPVAVPAPSRRSEPEPEPASEPVSPSAPEPAPESASEPVSPSAPEPEPAGRRRRTPSKAPARAAPAPSPEPAAEPDGWQPVRPGLSNPRTWLGTTAPNGSTYREDDLERIHGVGPYLARRLRDAGIVTWRQVAEWDDDDMTLVSRLVGSFPDRIRREDWPASARALHEEAYGETLP